MIDVVILGGGHMGALHARAFAEAAPERARVVGVFDVDEAAMHRVAIARGVRAFGSLAEALDAADLTVVATPIDTHRALAQEALFAGSAVLVEKPVCATLADASALVRAQSRSGRPVFVGHSERFNPVVVALRAATAHEAVRRIALSRLAPQRRIAEHGVAKNLAVHDFDLAALFLGGPILVQSARGDRDAIRARLSSAAGGATVLADQRASTRERKLELETDHAHWRADLLGRTLTKNGAPYPVGTDEPLLLQARSIVDALEDAAEAPPGSPRAASLAEGIAALTAALAVETALEEHRPTAQHTR